MKKNGKNEELQSKRELFKKVSKGDLPILEAVVFTCTHSLANAANNAVEIGCSSSYNLRCSGCGTVYFKGYSNDCYSSTDCFNL